MNVTTATMPVTGTNAPLEVKFSANIVEKANVLQRLSRAVELPGETILTPGKKINAYLLDHVILNIDPVKGYPNLTWKGVAYGIIRFVQSLLFFPIHLIGCAIKRYSASGIKQENELCKQQLDHDNTAIKLENMYMSGHHGRIDGQHIFIEFDKSKSDEAIEKLKKAVDILSENHLQVVGQRIKYSKENNNLAEITLYHTKCVHPSDRYRELVDRYIELHKKSTKHLAKQEN